MNKFKVGDQAEAVLSSMFIVTGQQYTVTHVYGEMLHVDNAILVGFSHEYFKLVQEVPKPHVHAELMKAYADDPSLVIQFKGRGQSIWGMCDCQPSFQVEMEYRIKPDNSEVEAEIESLINSMAVTLKGIAEAEEDVQAINSKIALLKEQLIE